MGILTTSEAKNKIIGELQKAEQQVQIVSAFCKTSALEQIDLAIKNHLISKKIMVRFLLSDIIQGASDLSLYEYCKENGWTMYVRFDLHAKTYIFDRQRCILGSANLTNKGLGFNSFENYELSCVTEMDTTDQEKIDSLFNDAILMDDDLYALMQEDYNKAEKKELESRQTAKWNTSITKGFHPTINALFTYDFPFVPFPDLSQPDALDFMNLSSGISKVELVEEFRWSKAFLWLYNFLKRCDDNTSYFGEVTAALHNSLINDPKPYRKEVKDLLSNLLNWIVELKIDEIIVDRPNHSQRIRINPEKL